MTRKAICLAGLAAGLMALMLPCAASAATGDLVFGGCLTGNTAIGQQSGSGACADLPHAGSVGAAIVLIAVVLLCFFLYRAGRRVPNA